MDHGQLKKKLIEYYDGELDPASSGEVESHLLDCPGCRAEFTRWQKTSRALFPKTRVAESEFFVQRVMTRVKESEEITRPVRWSAGWRWLVPAVSLAAMFLVAMWPEQAIPLSMEVLLVHPQEAGASMLSEKKMTTDETLEFVMGGLS